MSLFDPHSPNVSHSPGCAGCVAGMIQHEVAKSLPVLVQLEVERQIEVLLPTALTRKNAIYERTHPDLRQP